MVINLDKKNLIGIEPIRYYRLHYIHSHEFFGHKEVANLLYAYSVQGLSCWEPPG